MYPTDYIETTPLNKVIEAEVALDYIKTFDLTVESMRSSELPALQEMIHAFCMARREAGQAVPVGVMELIL